MKILNLSEDTETLIIKEISPKENKKVNYHILHSGKIDKEVLKYVVYHAKASFEEIKKLLTFDFTKAENGESVIVINGTEMCR